MSDNNEEKLPEKKDIKSLLAVIPPAGSGIKQKVLKEKRIRIRYSSAKPGQILINPSLAKELGIGEKAEIVVAGKKKFVFSVVLEDSVPSNAVYANTDFMKENGVADNSIATLRSA
ncbi:MAG: hypothetical protein ACPLSO_05855 [Fervidicoccaceae archaeon]|jgi:hypothetical protein